MEAPIYNATVPEDEYPPLFVSKVSAKDRDSGENGQVSYHLVNNFAETFIIDSDTGEISTNAKLDREEVNVDLRRVSLEQEMERVSFVSDRFLRVDRGGTRSRTALPHRHDDCPAHCAGQKRQSAAVHSAVQRERHGERGDRHVRHKDHEQRPGHRAKRQRHLQVHGKSRAKVRHGRSERQRHRGRAFRQGRTGRISLKGS